MSLKKGASRLTLCVIRCLDFILSLTTLLLLAPLLLAISILLRFTGEGEIFYSQLRVGRGGREFRLLKFATMTKNSPVMGSGELTIHKDPRVLPLGRFLRKTKINELPQLWNVLVGDLSVIGPRPQTRRYHNLYHADDRSHIERIRPGLSGVGSIIFRNEEALFASIDDPVAFDDYVITPYKGQLEHWFMLNQSIYLYFELIIMTLVVVLFPSSKLYQRLLQRVPSPPSELSNLLSR